MTNEVFHQRFSELSDETRARNKREDRLLDVRLKVYEKEKNIRLNILRKEQYQLERTRLALIEDYHRIQQEKQKQSLPVYLSERPDLDESLLQLSNPELNTTDLSSTNKSKPITPTKIVRPHSAN